MLRIDLLNGMELNAQVRPGRRWLDAIGDECTMPHKTKNKPGLHSLPHHEHHIPCQQHNHQRQHNHHRLGVAVHLYFYNDFSFEVH